MVTRRPPNADRDRRLLRDYRLYPPQPASGENSIDPTVLTRNDPRLFGDWEAFTRQGGYLVDDVDISVDPNQNNFENAIGPTLLPDLNWGPHNIYNEDGSYNVHPPHGACSAPHMLVRTKPPQNITAAPARAAGQEFGYRDALVEVGLLGQPQYAEAGSGPGAGAGAEEEHNNAEVDDIPWDEWINFDGTE
ncbi:hypothetical protein A1O1_00510 [Capronia coronata CBS 617.96]|uniref:Uncharacterized protein n=1 Tax=Capronia coronata CBS 617.96 TaxID=1182541 RepID=W9ZLN9_9EURO|nr:uncharacterized protein A1O1_00510 [Capronia coronata CBS 617.96]EXJ95389.1 hypothetical protein A1O1_00510 [Capronia coronata CBS 617.96]